jgi:hypothetical protein
VTPEQIAARNANISEGQRRAWADPEIRKRRSAAIGRAQDDPLYRAVMRDKTLRRLASQSAPPGEP